MRHSRSEPSILVVVGFTGQAPTRSEKLHKTPDGSRSYKSLN